ncbi:ABC transporter permease [Parasporobacterium paucivorans]|uniref:ABC-2 family transporter protein n=1 Tax=Parasporobacterium paucivorans DSM 15970 TaxID=1122934 RepID=A0A1M6HL26_9FIRM|nr:ABC transporter permease subunit [Parasporobacterium paucivorans]SHJ22881.1 ABC-2 family transporter protein [Parasporobacterium paucivorans DSM 15970]
MNILKKELRSGIKVFTFWILGLIFIDFAGLTKFTGIAGSSASVDVVELMGRFPRIILAVFGVVNLDVSSLGGYYSVLHFYVLVCVSIYAIHMGGAAISRETSDRTYEFIFTKPRSRSHVVGYKLLSGAIFLAVFCIIHAVLSMFAIASLNLDGDIGGPIILFGTTAFLTGILYLTAGAFLAAFSKRNGIGMLAGNIMFLATFIIGVVSDMFEKGSAVRYLTPLKYFLPNEILQKNMSILFFVINIAAVGLLLYGTMFLFDQKDLIEG